MDSTPDISFVDGSARLEGLLERPGVAEDVAEIRDRMRAADHAHAMTLAMVRHAAGLTQSELARRLEVTQAAVARTEKRGDMLLSTLRSYLAAAGAEVSLVVSLADGTVTEVSLDSIAAGERSSFAQPHASGD